MEPSAAPAAPAAADGLARLHQFRTSTAAALSPASLMPARAAWLTGCDPSPAFVWATRDGVWAGVLEGARLGDAPADAYTAGKRNSLLTAPRHLPPAAPVRLAAHAHACEVQAVAAATLGGRAYVASVDALGRGVVSAYDAAQLTPAALAEPPLASASFAVPGVRESGWAAVALSPTTPWRVAAAHGLARSVAVFEAAAAAGVAVAGPPQQTLALVGAAATQGVPVAVAFLTAPAPGHLVAVAEGAALGVYDVAQPRPCLAREPCGPAGSSGPLFALASAGGLVALGGQGAVVYIFDARGLKSTAAAAGGQAATAPLSAPVRWLCPAKYDITGLALTVTSGSTSGSSELAAYGPLGGLVYVVGADQEVLCGGWEVATVPGSGASVSGGGGGGASAGGGKRRGAPGAIAGGGGGGGEGRHAHAGGFTGRPQAAPSPAAAAARAAGSSDGVGAAMAVDDATAAASAAPASAAPGSPAPPASRVGAATVSGFRGDSRWVGLAVADAAGDGPRLLALTEGGWGYVVTRAQCMAMAGGGRGPLGGGAGR
jgi:hypothetical protein